MLSTQGFTGSAGQTSWIQMHPARRGRTRLRAETPPTHSS
jgi:hypothetical protein